MLLERQVTTLIARFKSYFRKSVWLAVLLGITVLVACGQPVPTPTPPANPSIALLMGDQKRLELEARITASRIPWEKYSAWGQELIENGFVQRPPEGPVPSPRLSQSFTCTNCHNTAREDPNLAVQNPEARVEYIRLGHPDVWLAPATTFWGMTDRVSFYNDSYAQYHVLCVPEVTTNQQVAIGGPDSQGNCAAGTRQMNPYVLEDAIQVCSAYCSVGRYMVRWELDSVLAYLYDNQVHLDDLQLTPAERTEIVGALLPPVQDADRVNQARTLLSTKYLRQAGDTYRDIPALAKNADGTVTVGTYPDGSTYTGDATRGGTVYQNSCAHCHGTTINAIQGAALGANVEKFYTALAKGITPPDVAYMPEVTLQRLSRQQSADLLAYLGTLGK